MITIAEMKGKETNPCHKNQAAVQNQGRNVESQENASTHYCTFSSLLALLLLCGKFQAT